MSGAPSAAAGRRHRLLLGAALFLVVAQILVPELTYNNSQRRQAVEMDDGGWLPSFGFGDNHTLLGRDAAVEEVTAVEELVTVDPSKPPTLFICRSDDGNGMAEFRAVFKSILSDYVVKDLSGVKRPIHIVNTPSNTYDVLIGVSGNLGCHAFVHQWILTDYRGHIAVYSPESDRESSDKTRYHKYLHYFGPALAPVRETDMVLTYFQTTWWTYFREALPVEAMVNATLRPQYQGLGRSNATSTSSNYMIYAQNNCVEFRDVAAWRFSKYGILRCGGQCCGKALDGNTTNLHRERVGSLGSWRDNVGVYAQYKFCLVMEHEREHESYVTEKLLMAFIGGCIPIYHGPPELIFDMINPRAFVFYNVSHPEPALALVEALHTNETLYRQMQQEPIVARGDNTIEKYFSFADDVGGGALKRRIRRVLGIAGTNAT